MSRWTDQWRGFIRETSYMHHLKDKGISNDQFWRDYAVYDQVLAYAAYPGEILKRVSSFIPPGATFLDIGAGTGAFSLPISRRSKWTIAVDPSAFHLSVLMEKARNEGLTNIKVVEKEWRDVLLSEVQNVEFSLAAYSLFEEDIERFLGKIMDVSGKGIFIVFRADSIDPLNDFAYGKKPSADYLCLYNILKEMGYQFDAELFFRSYILPLELVFKQYRFSRRSPEELADHLRENGRLLEKADGDWASFIAKDALLYMLR